VTVGPGYKLLTSIGVVPTPPGTKTKPRLTIMEDNGRP